MSTPKVPQPIAVEEVLEDLGVPVSRPAQLILRPMLPVNGVRRTLVMGVVLGDLCPAGVDRRVEANVTLDIVAAESARRRGKDGYSTEDFSHASLMLTEHGGNPELWEHEPGFKRPRAVSAPAPAPRGKARRKR